MARQLNYRQIADLLATSMTDFQGNTMWGRWEQVPGNGKERLDAFVVYSYRTAIAEYRPSERVWLIRARKWSTTTSKHQGILRRAAGTRCPDRVVENVLWEVYRPTWA